MHAEPGEIVALVPVPVLRWKPLAAITADLALSDDPLQVINRQPELQRREKDLRLRAFLRGLHPARRDIARLLAEGLDNQAIMTRRDKKSSTVTKQISAIYAEWRNFWGLPENNSVRDQIVAELSGYFSRNPGEV